MIFSFIQSWLVIKRMKRSILRELKNQRVLAQQNPMYYSNIKYVFMKFSTMLDRIEKLNAQGLYDSNYHEDKGPPDDKEYINSSHKKVQFAIKDIKLFLSSLNQSNFMDERNFFKYIIIWHIHSYTHVYGDSNFVDGLMLYDELIWNQFNDLFPMFQLIDYASKADDS